MRRRPPRTVVCNTSPIVYLHRIGRLDLLPALYGEVILPDSVCAELERGRDEGYDVPDWRELPWAKRRATPLPQLLLMVPDLGAGEAEVIALGLELGHDVLLVLDDGLARRIARVHGLAMTGTTGILTAAKRDGLLPLVAPMLEALLGAGFYLRPEVCRETCRISDEEWPE
ncbi:DUF3368 domain-containing protein [Candidatus Fermentibacteria bacterium]|nr:DUF3368 domain-containing protein [Candidatus Fermentibacteria bacterium]